MQSQFQITPAVSYEDAALWLFKNFDQELKKQKTPKTKQKKKHHVVGR